MNDTTKTKSLDTQLKEVDDSIRSRELEIEEAKKQVVAEQKAKLELEKEKQKFNRQATIKITVALAIFLTLCAVSLKFVADFIRHTMNPETQIEEVIKTEPIIPEVRTYQIPQDESDHIVVDAMTIDGAKLAATIYYRAEKDYDYEIKIAAMKVIRGVTVEHMYEKPNEVLSTIKALLNPNIGNLIDHMSIKYEAKIEKMFDRLREARMVVETAKAKAEAMKLRMEAESRIAKIKFEQEMTERKRNLEMLRLEEIERAKLKKEVEEISGKSN